MEKKRKEEEHSKRLFYEHYAYKNFNSIKKLAQLIIDKQKLKKGMITDPRLTNIRHSISCI